MVFYEKPLLKFERVLTTVLGTFPRSWGTFRESMVAWFNEKLWIKSHILGHLKGLSKDRLLFVEHHLSHAASAFFCSPFEEASVITADGVGEWTTAAIGQARATWDGVGVNEIELSQEIKFPHSLGLLYSAFTAYLGFQVNEGEYKVMGMAPFGEPKYVDEVYKVVDVQQDGSFQLDMDYFSFANSTSRTYNGRFEELFGPSRVPESEFFTVVTHPGRDHPEWSERWASQNQRYADIAASIQLVTEETLLKMASHAYGQTGLNRLCMAGGVALNAVANGRILRESPFEELYIQPAAGDSGGALGAALYTYHVLLGKPRQFVLEHCYWGQEYSKDEITEALTAAGATYESVESDDRLTSLVAYELMNGSVVGWFQGRFEWGPRALGNRSILADPRRVDMKDIVNTKIKLRESFRPFAPVVLEERASDYFDLTQPQRHYPARFMQLVLPIHEAQREKIPAITHVDGSGRLQTIRSETNTRFHQVVEKFGECTGVPVVLNTSFNLRGEPIVASPADALNTFAKSGLDTLVLDTFVVRKGG